MYNFGFIIEQALGHVTHSKNLLHYVRRQNDISAYWNLPRWDIEHGIASKVNNWTLKAGLQARKSVREMNRFAPMDALFFHTQVTAMLSQDWMRKIPSIVSLDATPLQYDAMGDYYDHEAGFAPAEKTKWMVHKRTFQLAQGIITWSSWAKQSLVVDYDIPAHKITVLPPGVIVSDWIRPEPRVVHNDAVKLLFVGGDLERKGGLLLIDALRTLRNEGLNVELHLVTRDEHLPEEGLFIYNDMKPNSAELKQLYYDCDVFCLPTYADCLAIVLAEAGTTGMPLVSTRMAAIPELVKDGQTGFLMDVGDTGQLVRALRRLVTDPELRLKLGQQANTAVRAEFDAAKNASKIIDLMKALSKEEKKVVASQLQPSV